MTRPSAPRARTLSRQVITSALHMGNLDIGQYDGPNLRSEMNRLRPAGAAKARQVARPPDRGPITRARYTDANPMDVKTLASAHTRAGDAVIREGHADFTLAKLYALQGFNARPEVRSQTDLDAFVAAGEVELFRGMRSNAPGEADTMAEAYRSGTHFAGVGIYGNGSYFAGAGMSVGADSAKKTAQGYAGSDRAHGSMLRATIRHDAKVGDYKTLHREAGAAHQELQRKIMDLTIQSNDTVWSRYHPLINRLHQEERGLGARPARKSKARDAWDAKKAAIDARRTKIATRANREVERTRAAMGLMQMYEAQTVYNDTGRYAASRGYDVIHEASNDFYVVLNRGALRVQDSDPQDG